MKQIYGVLLIMIAFILSGCVKERQKPIEYVVNFYDYNDIIVKSEIVAQGDDAIAPILDEVNGYIFIEWDTDFTNVQNDLHIRPLYEPVDKESTTFTVKFYVDDILITTQTIKKGESAISPLEPEKEGYIFIGWDTDFTNVQSDLHINAIYELDDKEPTTYEVKFYVDGNLLESQTVKEGENATSPNAPAKLSYSFLKWDQNITNITSNLEVNAIYERTTFVSFINELDVPTINGVGSLVDDIKNGKINYTFKNVRNGGPRGSEEIVYYNKTTSGANHYGTEVAADANGFVVDIRTTVKAPAGGFVISGHDGAGRELAKRINVGDLLSYNKDTQELHIYRDKEKSNIVGQYIILNDLIDKINAALAEYKVLDYKLINQRLIDSINLYNGLLSDFSADNLKQVKQYLLDIEFLLLENKPVQTRAVWHYPVKSGYFTEWRNESIIDLLTEYKLMGINRIYLNTNFNGRAIYKSDILTQALTNNYIYEGYKDYLECFIAEAHKLGISVIAWTNTLIGGDGMNNPFYANKGWLSRGLNGEDNHGGMYFLDVGNPEVRQFLVDVFTELAENYDLDGIEFDFIRFPVTRYNESDFGYTESFMNAFKEKYNFTGDLNSAVRTDRNLWEVWRKFREDTLSDFVEELTTAIKSVKPEISLTGAVMPSITGAKNTYLQNWELWIDSGWIDTLEPMIYTGDDTYLIDSLTSMLQVVNGRADIIVGIFPEGSGLSAAGNAEQIDLIHNFNIMGWSKFSSKTIFQSIPFRNSLSLSYGQYNAEKTAAVADIYKAYVLDLQDKVDNYYINLSASFYDLSALLNSKQVLSTTNYQNMLDQIKALLENTAIENVKSKLIKEHQFIYGIVTNKINNKN